MTKEMVLATVSSIYDKAVEIIESESQEGLEQYVAEMTVKIQEEDVQAALTLPILVLAMEESPKYNGRVPK